jgi:RNA polymerase sigma-70 factor (ECF subfamily)
MSMTDSPETRDSLLLRIGDLHDREAWVEFVSIYRPLIYRVGRRHGLQDADAQNLTQEVLQKVQRQAKRWESGQARGSFRRWLATVARNAAIDAIRRVLPDAARGGDSIHETLRNVPARDDGSAAEFRLELERQAFRWAARRIRSEFTQPTWIAFWETMVEGRLCAEVAGQLGRSVGAIYTARSRVMQRLKEELAHFVWDETEETANPQSTGDES